MWLIALGIWVCYWIVRCGSFAGVCGFCFGGVVICGFWVSVVSEFLGSLCFLGSWVGLVSGVLGVLGVFSCCALCLVLMALGLDHSEGLI